MVVYHATEIAPEQVRRTDDYGLFSINGTTNGTRRYGKSRENTTFDNDNLRRAYCQGIYAFAASLEREYNVDRGNSGCDANE